MSVRAAELNVAVCQLTSSDSIEGNAREIERLLNSIEAAGQLDLICFPENSLYFGINEGDPRPGVRLNDEAVVRLSRWAVNRRVPLHLGSVPLMENGKCYNASLLLTPDGNVTPVYKKIHLFDVDVVGQKPVRESEVFARGTETSIFELKGWKFGSSICYDVRFAELYLRYAKAGVDVILVPSAFLTTTGEAHWEILLRARAIESQAYVLASAQGGAHHGAKGGARVTHGHSMIVDPWGRVVEEVKDAFGAKVIRAGLRAETIEAVRRQIPMKNHRTLG